MKGLGVIPRKGVQTHMLTEKQKEEIQLMREEGGDLSNFVRQHVLNPNGWIVYHSVNGLALDTFIRELYRVGE